MPLFECHQDLPRPVEVACSDDGRTVLRLRQDTPVTPHLVRELNELLGDVDCSPGATAQPVVPDTVVIVLPR